MYKSFRKVVCILDESQHGCWLGCASRNHRGRNELLELLALSGKEVKDQFSWVIWRATSQIREPIMYFFILIFTIIYFQLSPNIIGIEDQYTFRNRIDDLVERVIFFNTARFSHTMVPEEPNEWIRDFAH